MAGEEFEDQSACEEQGVPDAWVLAAEVDVVGLPRVCEENIAGSFQLLGLRGLVVFVVHRLWRGEGAFIAAKCVELWELVYSGDGTEQRGKPLPGDGHPDVVLGGEPADVGIDMRHFEQLWPAADGSFMDADEIPQIAFQETQS
jgi:hypothetical protein